MKLKIKDMSYHFSKTVSTDFDTAIEKVTEELKKEGFGILTQIDVQETLKKKLDVNFKKYKILLILPRYLTKRRTYIIRFMTLFYSFLIKC